MKHIVERNTIELWSYVYLEGKKTKYLISTTGEVKNGKTGKVLKPFVNNSGYKRVNVSVNGERKKFSIHRMVAIAFIPIPKKYLKQGLGYDDLVPNHKDGNKLNNHVWNLEWMTTKENTIDAVNSGLCGYIGENSHLAKMDKKTAIKCCKMLSKGESFATIADKLGITKKMVMHIKSRECWKSVSANYVFPVKETGKPNSIPLTTIHETCKLLEQKKFTDKEIAQKVGLTREYVRDIRNKKRQKKVSASYKF